MNIQLDKFAARFMGLYAILVVLSVATAAAQIPSTLGWYQIPNTQLQSACPPDNFNNSGYPFYSACHNVIDAWGGGAADTTRNRLIVWGGGHSDYGGNEVYALDLNSLQMLRLNDPALPVASSCVESLTGPTPNSRHTYDDLAYIAHADRMSTYTGSLACSVGNGSDALWTLNMSNLQWTLQNDNNPSIPKGGLAASDYDPNTKNVFIHTVSWGNFASYNYDTNTLKILANNQIINYYTTAVVDPKRRFFFMFGAGQAVKIDISGNDPTYALKTLNASGCSFTGVNAPGAAYDSVQDRIVGWSGGNAVYLYNPDADSCTSVAYPNGPGLQQPNGSGGTSGRFRYFPALNVFALVNAANQNAYTLRLTSGTQGTTPPSVPTGLAASAASSSQIDLSWTASTDNVGVAGYKVLRCQGSGCTPSVQIAIPISNSFQDAGLAASTAYSYAVSAFDAAGNNSARSAPASATTLSSGGGGITPEQDFANRCGAPGVLRCEGWDNASDFVPANGSYASGLYPADDGTFQGVQDTAKRTSGTGSLRFNIRAGSVSPLGTNPAGLWWANFGPDANITKFGPHTTLYLQFRWRVDSNMLTFPWNTVSGEGWKVFIAFGPIPGPSCTGDQFVQENTYQRNVATAYTSCGTPGLETNNGVPPYLLEQGDYNCPYNSGGGYASNPNCFAYPANTWMTEYWIVQTGDFGQPNSYFQAYIAPQGQPLKKWIDLPNFAFNAGGTVNEGLMSIILQPYFSGAFGATTNPSGTMWFDELVISSRPIAVPLDNSGTPPPADTTPPSVPANLAASAISSSQINLSWTASTDNVGVTGYKVFRCQGLGCAPSVQIAAPTSNAFQDTGLSAGTTYVYTISAFDAAGNVSVLSASASAVTLSSSNPPPTPPPADTKPGLRDTLVFPNPAVSRNPTIRAFLGQVGSVEITIFDAAGGVVDSASLGGSPTGISNGQYYYDYIWSGKKSSGIYFAVIHGKAADGSIVRARTKFAVVR